MEIKNILVPVDGSEGSDRAITHAISIAEICEAKLNFLYVANINQLAINACLSDAILEAVTKAGNVILDFATSNNADLIVMGSRGLGIVKGVLLGSVSQYIVEQARCPVLVVK